MVKPIILTFEDGTEYTLEFNRKAIVYLEDHGFKREEVVDKLMKCVPDLFHAAFLKNHPGMTQDESDKILFEDLGGISNEIAERLLDLYEEPYKSLLSEGGKPKNPKLKVRM